MNTSPHIGTTWLDRVKMNLREYSEPADTLNDLVEQWDFTGDVTDFGKNRPRCELCDHEQIRWGYTIRNFYTGHDLIVGSVCIERFKIATKEELDQITRRKIKQDQKNRVMAALAQLRDGSFSRYYDTHGAFTPKQAKYVFALLTRIHYPFDKKDYKIKIRRDRERSQIEACWDDIFECLTPAQLTRFSGRKP